MSLYKRKGSSHWWYSLSNPHGGPRIRKSTETSERRKAKEIHDQRQAELWKVKTTGRQFYEALSAWLDAKDRSVNELNAVEQIKNLYRDRPLTEVTGTSIEDIFGSRRHERSSEKRPVSAGTYNKHANIIRAAMNIALVKRWVDRIDKIPRKKEPKGKVKFLTREQFEILLSKLAEHQRPLFLFALATGLRWSNVSFMEWSRVDLQRKVAWVDADEMKGGEPIPVPLSPDAIKVLEGQIGNHDTYVFTYRGEPIKSPKTAFNRARTEAGLDNFRWHDIRHTWASWHVMGGTPLEVLQKLGAWKDPKMVQRYAHLDPGYIAQFAGNAKPYESNVIEIKKKRKKG